ncbi:uncharacterized protein [Dermacentor andersoni]|uniref:uncharacterized protein isoform X1 n=1 Tax=Dermacentor andersoni TaxID=34620 RepID=UPI002416FDDE|nr:uncharacterized protein LOC126522264 isoform X1 [Dermacentor andersoni]
MEISQTVTFGVLLATCYVHGKLGAPGGPQQLPYVVPDSFKVFQSFAFAVAISDSDNDTILECMSANRTAINPEEMTATYTFNFPNTQKEIPFYVKAGETPGTVTFTVGADSTQREGIIYYTDYVNCDVVDLDFHGHQCTLWARKEVKDNVPQNCIDYFVDTCGVVVPQHSRDLCFDGEGDYK